MLDRWKGIFVRAAWDCLFNDIGGGWDREGANLRAWLADGTPKSRQ